MEGWGASLVVRPRSPQVYMRDGDTDWGWGILVSASRKKLTGRAILVFLRPLPVTTVDVDSVLVPAVVH